MKKFLIKLKKMMFITVEPQKIGLSQFKDVKTPVEKKSSSLKNKDVKLSDLMRRDKPSSVSVTDSNI